MERSGSKRILPLQVVPQRFRARLMDFQRSGLDRGHMAPAMNHKLTQQDMDETFCLTNISPQVLSHPARNCCRCASAFSTFAQPSMQACNMRRA